MHNILCEPIKPARRLVNRRGSTVIAVLLLSLGVGASTAAFTLVNGVMPHSAPFVTCETTVEYTGDLASMPAMTPAINVPAPGELQERISDAYATSYEAAGDAVDSWSDAAGEVVALGDVGSRIFAVLLGAGALALLVTCTRAASRALATPRASTLFAGVALGALPVAALLASALGLPALGFRAIAFAMTVSVVAAYSARAEQKSRVGLVTASVGR
ncbi:MAG TPA: hypothetical protein VGO46_10495 [Gemmatimonadaceae bacterium]|jgi:hypothetical protein|nr:hypothetical protein [Gemmatimonadaceae bacterium]